ncbi:MAG TPA: Fic family protein [Ignavibacteria bacterium]|nr:Fic family protein [Ignavibacteria bacterium]
MGLLTDKYFTEFENDSKVEIQNGLEKLKLKNSETDFNFMLESSAVFSSNIEGNTIDFNSYKNLKNDLKKNKKKELDEIENLISAYSFAKENKLNENNFLNTHKILSEEILIHSKRGNYREEPVGIYAPEGLIYIAVESENVTKYMSELFLEIDNLLNSKLNETEIFYYSAMIHLRLAQIHPFMDGNGRIARLTEKWFLSHFLKELAWLIQSEKYYFNNRNKYYENLNLGQDFYNFDLDKCIHFLKMLPNSLKN